MSEQQTRRVDLDAFKDGGWFWETPMARCWKEEADKADELATRSLRRLLDSTHLGAKDAE